jgi:hypothetical protein
MSSSLLHGIGNHIYYKFRLPFCLPEGLPPSQYFLLILYTILDFHLSFFLTGVFILVSAPQLYLTLIVFIFEKV